MEDLVSIIIPVYNRENVVNRTIESAINQTYKNIEIIIGDNCSSDGTYKILEKYRQKYKRIKIFKNENNIGPVRNWEKCISLASGKYLKILFSDDWIEDDYIEKNVLILKNDLSIGFTVSKTIVHLGDNKLLRYDLNSESVKLSSKSFIRKYYSFSSKIVPFSPSAALFRKADVIQSLYTQINNPFNIDYNSHGGGPDMLLFLVIALKYKSVYYISSTMSHFSASVDSISLCSNLSLPYSYAKIFFLNKYYDYHFFLRLKVILKEMKINGLNFKMIYYFLVYFRKKNENIPS